jgi:hypothetical protein
LPKASDRRALRACRPSWRRVPGSYQSPQTSGLGQPTPAPAIHGETELEV